ncbi:NusA-like transcription termination signal-binding factor [Candidatus Nanohalobium constans]|uniref:Probable transcription termination protein NusA n=1 Tax=Candidatus Nanohalobium constans TaxID=2565781 RepID=A0A5Q0UGN9_9ARCH|nr:NusA-like transcription termination signal-binding factor [Candidatus Nanohalobium constans]QGA80777.1 transcription elongation factor NusA [Candidatus Nanohalobium constans]
MATATYDTEMIRTLSMFESLTDVEARDCMMKEDEAYFIVPEGKAGMAIGKGGKVVKKVQNQLGKNVKIFEYKDNLGAFVNNLVSVDIRSLDIQDTEDGKTVEINVSNDNKGQLVGRDGENIDSIRDILKRTHNVNEVTVK